jgi:ATP-binding cassette, subfamily B, bacterial MsbA
MKTFRRILGYANKLNSRLILFFSYSILGIIFGVFDFILMIPMLRVLFSLGNQQNEVVPAIPAFTFSSDYLITVFNHFFLTIIHENGVLNALLFVCVLILICTILANLFRYLERVMATKIRVDLVRNIRMDIFRKVSLLHIGYFSSQRKGDLISRFTNDLQEVENAVMSSLKAVLKEPITILVYFIVLFNISATLMAFTLLVLPITGGVLAEIIKRLKRQATASQESLGRIVNILDETFSGMRVIKAFNARNFVVTKMEDESNYYRRVNKSLSYKNELAAPVSEILGIMIMVGILYFGGNLVLNKKLLSPEAFIVFLGIFSMIIQPGKNFSNGITSLQRGTASADRIFSIIDTEPLIQSKPDAIKLDKFQRNIEFKNVSFAYEKDLVLKNINLSVEKGKTVALVGTSGGGKSTLADLVPRFYDPTDGDVCIDGISLRDYDLESIRQHMGVVTQESILFNDTIFNNIAFGMPGINEAAVIEAAKIANAHDFIMQTEAGYQTLIGERGSKLSGGQRQRLSIARAVLKNPPILILDEATSALDSESEKLVQSALFNLMKNRTSVVIAHRLSTIQHADEIIVIQKGEIIERGTHAVLSQQDGLYRKLSDIQLGGGIEKLED